MSLVDLATRTASSRLGRRTFLRRATMTATALAAAPADFLLRPTSAYAAICSCQGQNCDCGSLCCGGYTEFCCTLNGQNGCPPGTVAGGWWKVDGSQFCGGGPRYYFDCNAQCGSCGCTGGLCSGSCSGTVCGCAWGDCNNRKAGCVKFRYGQCNQQIECLGPIVCRVVTCTPPWVLDASCTTDSKTDNNTAQHHRPCLDAPFGAFDGVTDLGGRIRLTGWAIDQNNLDQVHVRIYVDEKPAVVVAADRFRADVASAYPYYGANHGFEATVDASPGRHVLCIYAVDQGSGVGTFLAFTEFTTSPAEIRLSSVAGGSSSIRLTGWSLDRLAPPTPTRVRVLVDNVVASEFVADDPRSDMPPGVNAQHGFDVTVPASIGKRRVCVETLHVASGLVGARQCRAVVVRP